MDIAINKNTNALDHSATTSSSNKEKKEIDGSGPFIRLNFSDRRSLSNKSLLFNKRSSKSKKSKSVDGDDNDDDTSSIGSSVASGFRNSLHSSVDYNDALVYGDDDDDDINNSSCNSFAVDDLDEEFEIDINARGGDSVTDKTATAKQYPSWRLDPKESGSDYTMIIKAAGDEADADENEIGTTSTPTSSYEASYHVHRNLLTSGPKLSFLFITMFPSFNSSHGSGGSTEYEEISISPEEDDDDQIEPDKIILHQDSVDFVPIMLDYLYSPKREVEGVTSENAVGLKYLSQFFGIKLLEKEIVKFIYKDMSMKNMKTYLQQCNIFDDIQTLELCSTRCSQNILQIKSKSLILKEMDAAFLLDIISKSSLPNNTDDKDQGKATVLSLRISKLVATFCTYHVKKINASAFEEITMPEYMPVVCSSVALSLLVLEATLVPESGDETKHLTYLQKQCIAALSKSCNPRATKKPGGKTSDNNDSKDENQSQNSKDELGDLSKDVLSMLPKKVLIELLTRTINFRGVLFARQTAKQCK